MRCSKCNSEEIVFKMTPNSVHYGQDKCKGCGKWIRWVKNPESLRTKNPKRIMKLSVQRVCTYHKFKTEHCFFCLKTKDQLGLSETLTVDHIEELNHGGTDEIENQQVLCTACHKLKNWARLYTNWHITREDNDGKDPR